MPEPTRPATGERAEVLAALPTFFDGAGELDRGAASLHLAGLVGRVDGVFVAGTTGEFPALDPAERRELAEAALGVFGPDRVVVHTGAASTRDTLALTRDAVALGVRRIAVLTPYYLPVDSDTVLRHMAAVTAAAGPAAVYGYLFTERSGVVVEPADLARIAAGAGLAGGKLSGAANDRFGEYLDALPAGGRLWSGADTSLAAVVRRGGAGIVSGLSAAFPAPFAALADAVAAGDAGAEQVAQADADRVLAVLGGTPQAIKLALHHLGIGTAAMRMPVPESDAAVRRRIADLAAASPTPVTPAPMVG